MPNTVSFEPDDSGVIVQFSGVVSFSEIEARNKQFVDHPAFARWQFQIWDFSDADDVRLELDDVRQLASNDSLQSRRNLTYKVAIVPRSSIQTGFNVLYQTFVESWGKRVVRSFSDRKRALEWVRSESQC